MQADTAFIKQRSEQLYRSERVVLARRKDRMFAVLFVLQWLAGIAVASWYGPHTVIAHLGVISVEILAAAVLGGVFAGVPLFFIFRRPGSYLTRHVVAAGQMLFSALLIHLSGGRTEVHFHIFGSLAFLAFYRDWRVLVTASVVVAVDQFARGTYWPQSIYGVGTVYTHWRWVEHILWVVFEDIFLIFACIRGDEAMYALAETQAEVEDSRSSVERAVGERTAQLAQSNRDLGQARSTSASASSRNSAPPRTNWKAASASAPPNSARPTARSSARSTTAARTEEELARTVQRYRFTTDSVPQIVWTAGPDGNIDYFNRRFHEYTGMTVEDARNGGWLAAVHPDDQRSADRMRNAIETGVTLRLRAAHPPRPGRQLPLAPEPRHPDARCRRQRRPMVRHRYGHRRPETRPRDGPAQRAALPFAGRRQRADRLADRRRVPRHAGPARMARRHRPDVRADVRTTAG